MNGNIEQVADDQQAVTQEVGPASSRAWENGEITHDDEGKPLKLTLEEAEKLTADEYAKYRNTGELPQPEEQLSSCARSPTCAASSSGVGCGAGRSAGP